MKKLLIIIMILLLSLSVFADDDISFSGGYSRLSLKEGRESLTLSRGSKVVVNTLSLTADELYLSGEDYSLIESSGNVLIVDDETGLTIKTSRLSYDRTRETLLISAWSEISDTVNELEASSAALYYDMDNETLTMQMQVRLLINTDSGLLSATAESLIWDREAETFSLSGNASVSWKGNTYAAEAISVNLKNDSISLDGRIMGTIYG